MSNQLIKETSLGFEKIFPKNYILNLKDKDSGKVLSDILKSFNMLFLNYTGNKSNTRKQVPVSLRHGGLWITYIIDKTIVTEWYNGTAIDDYSWGSDVNWREGSNMLVGDISISKQGTWVINGEDSGITIKGDKGDSPVIRIYDNKILVSYDKGVTYEDLNNTPVYTKFRFNSLTNTYLVSYDLGANWEDISDEKVYHKFRYNSTTNTYLESIDFGKTWSNISAEKVYTKFKFNRSTNTYQVSTDLGQNWTDVSSDKVYYLFRYNGETNTHLVSTDFGATWTNVSEDKVFYLFRTEGNRLLVSTDLGTTWENCSEPIAAWFRWADVSGTGNVGKVQISRDNKTWTDLSPTMTNNLYIKDYVATVEELPTSSAAIGDIYMVGPTYDESDTTHDYPHYRMWVKLSSGWVDNGEFTNAGPVSTSNIIDGAVTTPKIEDGAITYNKLQSEIKEVVEGVTYTENPEFLLVKTDSEGHILYAIKSDGTIYYGVGIPPQVKDALSSAIKDLQQQLSQRIDDIGTIESLPYLDVVADAEGKIISYITTEGTYVHKTHHTFDGGVTLGALESVNIGGNTISALEADFVDVILDAAGRILCGIKPDGSIIVSNIHANKVISPSIPDVSNLLSRTALDSALMQVSNKPASKHILYVKKDGTGDFTEIQEAINSITDASPSNQYEIRVCDDYTYTSPLDLWDFSTDAKNTNYNPTHFVGAIQSKDWVDVIGYNRVRRISVFMPDDVSGNSLQNYHNLFLRGNCRIENFLFEIKNGRYAIHQEGGGKTASLDYKAQTYLKNVKAYHLGNTVQGWDATYGQANGSTPGLELFYENVEWYPGFYMHGNKNFDTNNKYHFLYCKMANNNISAYIGANGSGQNTNIELIGCDFKALLTNRGIMDDNVITDDCHDIRTMIPIFTGHSNSKMIMAAHNYSTMVLSFKTLENGHNVKVVGGTAMKDIYGEDLYKYDGTQDAFGCCMGTEVLTQRGTTYGFLLSHRLGNCANSPKTLKVSLDGVEQTVIFDKNYVTADGSNYDFHTAPAISDNQIKDDINSQLTGVVCVDFGKSHYIHEVFGDQCEIGLNTSQDTILSGMPVVRDPDRELGAWIVCEAGQFPDGIAGERINPNCRGNITLIDKVIFTNLNGTSLQRGKKYKVIQKGIFGETSDSDYVLSCIGSGAVIRSH